MSRSDAVLATLAARLRAAGVEQPRLDARLLLAHALQVDAGWVFTHPEYQLLPAQLAHLERLAARRLAREPVSRIVGRREFWGLVFRLSPATLDPRPDTETVVEAVLAHRPDRQAALRILDLGTGSGCILLALLSEYRCAEGWGIDLSAEAVMIARANAADLGLSPRCRVEPGDWGDHLAWPGMAANARFDIIVANPPYIEDAAIDGLAPEVACHDPRLALAGGPDGLDAYRSLLPSVTTRLAAGGLLALEIGAGQHAAVLSLFSAADYTVIDVRRDLAGIARCLVLGSRTL